MAVSSPEPPAPPPGLRRSASAQGEVLNQDNGNPHERAAGNHSGADRLLVLHDNPVAGQFLVRPKPLSSPEEQGAQEHGQAGVEGDHRGQCEQGQNVGAYVLPEISTSASPRAISSMALDRVLLSRTRSAALLVLPQVSQITEGG